MTTHTCDCGTCDWTWRHVPAADHKPGSIRKIYHVSQYKTWPPAEGLKWDIYKKDFAGLEIPEVAHTYAYHHGMFGYMNEKQVAIGESTIGCQRKLQNPTPSAKLDLTMLTLLAMERAATAREAIQVIGSLAEKYGYGFHDDGEMLAIADPKEVWMFEIMPVGPLWTPESGKPGAVWCAQRVPDDEVSVCPNESRIGEIDLEKKDFFMASPNVVSLAVDMGFYDPKSGKPFNWKRAYSPVEGSAVSTQGRRSSDVALLRPRRPLEEIQARDAQHGLSLLRQAGPEGLRPGRHGHNPRQELRERSSTRSWASAAVLSRTRNYYKGTRLISVRQRRVHDHHPEPCLAAGSRRRHRLDRLRRPRTPPATCPFYAGATEMPKSFAVGDHFVFSRDSARWAFDYVDFHVQVAYNAAIEDVKAAQKECEDGAVIARIPRSTGWPATSTSEVAKEAAKFLTGYSLNNAQNVVARLVEARRRTPREIQPPQPLQCREAAAGPHPVGRARMVEQGRPGLRHPHGTRQEVKGEIT